MGSVYQKNTSSTEAASTQKAYTIGGVPIIFPYKAYPSQIAMMDKIIKSLNKKHNCLLESPTGSGKSLALLCATLAWLKKTEREIYKIQNGLNKYPNTYDAAMTNNVNCVTESTCSSPPDFENYNSYEKSKVKFETLECTACPNSFVEDKTTSRLTYPNKRSIVNEESGNKMSSDSSHSYRNYNFKNKLSPCINDPLKRQNAEYIDYDEHFRDFQPAKKKLFPGSQEMHQIEMPFQDYKCTATLEQNIKIDSPQKYSNPEWVSEAKSTPKKEVTNPEPPELPKVYFGTRTHKQIEQIIRELKKTSYKDVKMTILSSRDRTCIHPKNCKSHNKNEGCDELIKREGPGCRYFRNIQKSGFRHSEIFTPFDLEDFVSTCKQKQICPYFGARELLQTAEIVFCPYNYLVDPLIKTALNISLKGEIIIMDEAHNIEDSAREAASGCISKSQLQEVLADVLQIGQLKGEDSEPYMHIAKVLESLKNWLENTKDLNDYVSFDSSCKVWSGNDMLALLNYIGLGPDTFPGFASNYKKIVERESEIEKNEITEFKDLPLSGSTHVHLKNLMEILSCMYKNNFMYVPDYRCVIVKSKINSGEANIIHFSQTFKRKSISDAFELTMNFWCLNPAVTFSGMKDVHSIIVASGTLAPLTSFQSELGIPFEISLEANHVVSSENMWVGTIGKGPSNNSLNGNFRSASTFIFQDDVGNLVLEICSLIPHGVLCFLPSYGMLDKLVNRWQITGLWDKLLCKKVVLCEPRRSNDFQLIMQEFYEAVKDSESNNCGDIKGALFLAVCRGKVSEGLDFADNNARAVITIGIPFPNIKDAQVDLKRKYNDEHSSKRQIVTGSSWYEMQAFRAINQALGRCIRHKNDFGALVIVDERFQMHNRYTAALSKWIKKEIKHYFTFYDALNSLNSFAGRMGLKNSETE